MKHTNIFKCPDGLRIKVEVTLVTDRWRQPEFKYLTHVSVAPPRKRKFREPLAGEVDTKRAVYDTAMQLYFKLRPYDGIFEYKRAITNCGMCRQCKIK